MEHPVAISNNVKEMFHNVRLLKDHKPFLDFLRRDMNVEEEPTMYEWELLPLGTTCSLCCAMSGSKPAVQPSWLHHHLDHKS